MRAFAIALVGAMAIALAGPSMAKNNGANGTNPHAHQGNPEKDPQPDHGKDNNCADGGCQVGIVVE